MEVETAEPASREAYARKLCTTCSAMLRNSGAGCSAAADSVSEGKAEMAPPAKTEPEAPLVHGPFDVPRWSTGSACDVLVVSQARRERCVLPLRLEQFFFGSGADHEAR